MCESARKVVIRQVSTLTANFYAIFDDREELIATRTHACSSEPGLASYCGQCGWKFSRERYQYLNCDCPKAPAYFEVEADGWDETQQAA